MSADAAPSSARLLDVLRTRSLTIAVAESLTGGLLVAELISNAGASDVVNGGVAAYQTALKHSLLGVSAEVLAAHGAVHPDVAMQMAVGVRRHLSVGDRPADVGIATTGVAGPGAQDGHAAGTAFVGIAVGADVRFVPLALSGSRSDIRNRVVSESIAAVLDILEA